MLGRGQFLGHYKLKISRVYPIDQKDGLLDNQSPVLPSPPSSSSVESDFPQTFSHSQSSRGAKISPALLFIIVILAVLFFISGLLHLLVRFLAKSFSSSQSSRNVEASRSDALERQLQQLFHLHDSGLEQAFIDSLPVFSYKEIVDLGEPFDCAVCLCEFADVDQLRLLPVCGHAFHLNCIDTWLQSNSTCPLCRGAIFNPGFLIESPVFDFDDCREDGFGENGSPSARKRMEIEEVATEKGVFPVRLGKFRKVDDFKGEVGEETGSSRLDARRCYSMGSYQYVIGNSNLRVALTQGQANRDAAPSQGCDSADRMEGKKLSIGTKRDSYSVSKIWLWSKKGKFASSSEAPWVQTSF